MSDNNLPKPVPPQDSSPGDAAVTMPPSARPQSVPPASGQPPVSPPPGAAPVTPPPGSTPPVSPPPAAPLPGAEQPADKPAQPPKPGQAPPVEKMPAQPEKKTGSGQGGDKGQTKKKKPTPASVKQSPLRFLPYVVLALVLIGLGVFLYNRFFGSGSSVSPDSASDARRTVPAQQTTLTYWGLWEPTNAMEAVLTSFEEQNPGLTVNYVKQSHQDYRERLQSAIASGNGPDLFRFHASWTPMMSNELSSMPQSVMTSSEYGQTFYPVAVSQLSINGQIVGIPLMYDGLGLYYNKEMLKAANAEPPKTWAELKLLATNLTIKDGQKIERGGLAIGNASNVEHFSDILGLLMFQNGADPADPSSREAIDALTFYTNFIEQDQVWSEDLPSSTVAFARGDAAMMFAPSWRAHEVLALNPELDFGIVPVPTLGDSQIGWASYWAEGVSVKSDNVALAWQLLDYLSSAEAMQEMYSAQSQVRSFGEPYSRVDLADKLSSNQLVSPFLEDAPQAVGWYLNSFTHDNGINDLLIKYYTDAVNAVLNNNVSPEEALVTVDTGTTQVLRQYGVE